MSAVWAQWEHHADSSESLAGDFTYSFDVPSSLTTAVATGFRLSEDTPVVFLHGLQIQRQSPTSFSVRTITNDVVGAVTVVTSERFHITRIRGRVYYSYGDGRTSIEDNGPVFLIDGTLFAEIAALSEAEIELHARFLVQDDRIENYTFTQFLTNTVAAATLFFAPLLASGSTLVVSEGAVSASFSPMEVSIQGDVAAQVNMSFEPLSANVFASQEGFEAKYVLNFDNNLNNTGPASGAFSMVPSGNPVYTTGASGQPGDFALLQDDYNQEFYGEFYDAVGNPTDGWELSVDIALLSGGDGVYELGFASSASSSGIAVAVGESMTPGQYSIAVLAELGDPYSIVGFQHLISAPPTDFYSVVIRSNSTEGVTVTVDGTPVARVPFSGDEVFYIPYFLDVLGYHSDPGIDSVAIDNLIYSGPITPEAVVNLVSAPLEVTADARVTTLLFAPMTVAAYEENIGVDFTSGYSFFTPLEVYVYGVDFGAQTDIGFAPMSLYVGEYEWAGADVQFAPMQLNSFAFDPANLVTTIYAGFAPTFTGPEWLPSHEHSFSFDGGIWDFVGDAVVSGTAPLVPGVSGELGDTAASITEGNSIEITLPDPVGDDTELWHTEFSFVPPTDATEDTTIVEYVSDDGTQSIVVYVDSDTNELIIVITDTNATPDNSVTFISLLPDEETEFVSVAIGASEESGFDVAVDGIQLTPAVGNPDFYFDLPPNITIGGTGDGSFVFDELNIYSSEYVYQAGENDIVELLGGADTQQLVYVFNKLDRLRAAIQSQTFWTQTSTLTETVRALIATQPALVATLTELVESQDVLSAVEVVQLLEQARAFDSTQTFRQLSLELALLFAARDQIAAAPAMVLTDSLEAADATQLRELVQLLEALEAAMASQQVMTLLVDETLAAQAGDSTETLGRYLAEVTDETGVWLGFRLGDESFTGWVMNTEGEQPVSEYRGYDFNSFCRIGDYFYGAGDDGLYLLDGDTDAGQPINAAVRTMMLDFGSAVQKRVRNAYIGYTASGKLLLRVRTVDGGQLNEQWYEAQELQAQAPKEQMIRLGRGLRSRYWQFELVNIDGADFELDVLELHPVYLNRRV